jgi:hypothetical protein
MGQQFIDFTISKDGMVTYRPQGFAGDTCREATRRFEEAHRAAAVVDRQPAPAALEEAVEVSREHAKQ